MNVGIMQPYFYPYIGYFQLINYVDKFVIYDEIQYTKKGWINRNRFLKNGYPEYFTLPLKKDSDFLNVNERYLSDLWDAEKIKMLNQIKNAYQKAPNYKVIFALFEESINYSKNNLFEFILHSIEQICMYLEIKTEIVISSKLTLPKDLKSKDKVIAICKELEATSYINPIGGVALYDKTIFKNEGIDLLFLKARNSNYQQFDNEFVPYLSILDVLMFNSKEEVVKMLNEGFDLV